MQNNSEVYFNLHRKVWSIRSCATGLVFAHSRVVRFDHGAKAVVRQSGRAQVLRTGQKNVHAFIRGDSPVFSDDVQLILDSLRGESTAIRITYNPHKAGHFVNRDTGEKFISAKTIVLIAPKNAPPEVWAM